MTNEVYITGQIQPILRTKTGQVSKLKWALDLGCFAKEGLLNPKN